MKKLFLIAAVIFGFAATSFAQNSATATATATASLLAPITITNAGNMNFGILATSDVAGTATISTADVLSVANGVSIVNAGNASAASFTVTGEEDYSFSITLPSSHTITDGTNSMTVDNFTSDPDVTGTISGSTTLNVGATLNISADQTAGVYTSATGFDVTVAYN